MPTIKVQNLYDTLVTESGGIAGSGDVDFTVTTPPIYTNGWIVIEPENPLKRDLMYYHNVIGSRIYVRSVNRPSPKAHTSGVSVKMLDVAELFNYFSDMVSQLFYTEKTGGLTVRVWGGYASYNGSTVTVPDTNLTLVDNTTNYIKYDYPTNTVTSATSSTGNVKVVVTTLSGAITNIEYRNAKESFIDFTVSLTGALPSQSGNSGKCLITDGTNVSWGTPTVLRTGLAINSIVATNASGNEILLPPTAGHVVGFTALGVPTTFAQSMDINGLSADTVVDSTDTFPYFDGTTNKKITRDNLKTQLSEWAILKNDSYTAGGTYDSGTLTSYDLYKIEFYGLATGVPAINMRFNNVSTGNPYNYLVVNSNGSLTGTTGQNQIPVYTSTLGSGFVFRGSYEITRATNQLYGDGAGGFNVSGTCSILQKVNASTPALTSIQLSTITNISGTIKIYGKNY